MASSIVALIAAFITGLTSFLSWVFSEKRRRENLILELRRLEDALKNALAKNDTVEISRLEERMRVVRADLLRMRP